MNRFIIARPFYYYVFLVTFGLLFLAACGEEEVPEVIPPLVSAAPSLEAHTLLQAVKTADIPQRDLAELAVRLRGENDVPRQLDPIPYQVGDTENFWYKDHNANDNKTIDAELVYKSDQLYMWIEAGERINEGKIEEAATKFEQDIFPRNRELFGTEASPGVDGDARVHLLHISDIGGTVVGYFSQADEFVPAVNQYSNAREILYINLRRAKFGSDAYYDVVAHEMQHLIHWNSDGNETIWLNEGLSQLASLINGYEVVDHKPAFAEMTDIPFLHFSHYPDVISAHYGSAMLFSSYIYERFGEQAISALVSYEENGRSGIERLLQAGDAGFGFDKLFSDWLAHTYLEGEGFETGYFSYEVPEIKTAVSHKAFPIDIEGAVNQYGGDFVKLESNEPLTLTFTGSRQVPLMDIDAPDGDFFFSSLPADSSDLTLTKSFELPRTTPLTLSYQAWFGIEEGWDYAYVLISDDDGQTWQPQQTLRTANIDKQGNSYGVGYSGNSGGWASPQWVDEQVDLSQYAGQTILVRFEYITDDAFHLQGFSVDNIQIPEIDYAESFETDEGDWASSGFVRHANVLPQTFSLNAILIGEEAVDIMPLKLNESQYGEWLLPLGATYQEAVIIITGNTPVTQNKVAYRYEVTQQ